jgi:adenylate kinase family enzyme
MERVVVLGPAGAGKSELATRLSRTVDIPVVHLDTLFWAPGWRPAPESEARAALERVVAGERWILDGNFLADDSRFARADTVVFLDLPRRVCFRRVLVRLVRDRRRSRPDLPEGCREGLDLGLLWWIWRYPRTDRPRVLALLRSLPAGTRVLHLRSHAHVDAIVKPNG